jgi:hypothetical protein
MAFETGGSKLTNTNLKSIGRQRSIFRLYQIFVVKEKNAVGMFPQPLSGCHYRAASTSLSTHILIGNAHNWDRATATFPEIYCANAICGWNISDEEYVI